MTGKGKKKLHIRPKVGMYGAFARLNYKHWFALAEFVDNSIQSFVANRAALSRQSQPVTLTVRIKLDPERIVIEDNAAGIRAEDFPRAFSPAEPPPDNSGLSEFGIGMKAASCWLAKNWTLRTTAIGEDVERKVSFNIPEIIRSGEEDLEVEEKSANPEDHYTVLVLEDLNHPARTRTIGKIKRHLASMYRRFLEEGTVTLLIDHGQGYETLTYTQPAILVAPPYNALAGPERQWRKPINIKLDKTRRISGWAALRDVANVGEAGFAVFRRNRLIYGGVDDTYRPSEIFGKPNSYTYQRLFGELSVQGFQVSHTKDGLQWEEFEEDIHKELLKVLDAEPLPLLKQAENFRKRATPESVPQNYGQGAVNNTATTIEMHAPPVISEQLEKPPTSKPPVRELPPAEIGHKTHLTIEVEHEQRQWSIVLELVQLQGSEDWLTYSLARPKKRSDPTVLRIQINLAHPFSEKYALRDEQELEPLLRMGAGLILAEVTSIESGVAEAPTIRRNFNHYMREVLWKT